MHLISSKCLTSVVLCIDQYCVNVASSAATSLGSPSMIYMRGAEALGNLIVENFTRFRSPMTLL